MLAPITFLLIAAALAAKYRRYRKKNAAADFKLEFERLNASRSIASCTHNINQNGATAWFEMCFAPSTVYASGAKHVLNLASGSLRRFCFYDWGLKARRRSALGNPEQGPDLADGIEPVQPPREMPRAWLTLVECIGRGNFGEVWKGLLKDRDHAGLSHCTIPIP